jgi:hypothetical protein
MPRRLAAFALIAAGAAGCSSAPPDDKPARFPTRGTVTYNGKPPKGAVVVFHPLPPEKNDWRTIKPSGSVAADGSFQPNSYDLRDGAMAGEYALTVTWAGEDGAPRADLFLNRYNDPKNPVLRVTIKEGENVLPAIELKGPPVNPKAGGKGDL